MRLISPTCLILFLALLAASGCGKSLGNVSGKVVYEGKPVEVGSVILIGTDDQMIQVAIEPGGTYTAKDVPYGPIRAAVVSVEPMSPKKFDKLPAIVGDRFSKMPKTDGNESKWFKIPAIYGDYAKSGLNFTVDKKENTFNIEMKAQAEEPQP